ncbi:ABC transporter permease [Pseudoduganella sp. OTU4001]|uniref:ABC transporter permease n=1 Tax=Pseudoduganella sp. OTU4001 TaxID=3043854 RepID=UPI00313D5193
MLKNYLLTAWNVAQRRKLFTAINLACIVLTLVVLLVVTALLQEAFYPSGVEHRSNRFLQIQLLEATNDKQTATSRSPLGYRVIDKFLKPMQGKELEAVATVSGLEPTSVIMDGANTEVQMRHADAEYWRVMDFKVLAGRVPSADDVAQGRMVAVLSRSMARKLFNDPAPLGRKVEAGAQSFSVIGVVEDAMHLNAYADMWVPLTTYPNTMYRQQMTGTFVALLLARSPDDLPAIRKQVQRIARSMDFTGDPEFTRGQMWADSKIDLFARMLTSSRDFDADTGSVTIGGALSGTGLVLGGVGLLMLLFMLLPALNLVNLNIGRIMERSTEIGVRKAFGATNRQLALQLVLENVVLCLAGGAIALACAAGVLWWLEAAGPIPYLKVGLNLAVFGWGLLITVVFGVLSGVLPAWKMSRLDPVHALKGAA